MVMAWSGSCVVGGMALAVVIQPLAIPDVRTRGMGSQNSCQGLSVDHLLRLFSVANRCRVASLAQVADDWDE